MSITGFMNRVMAYISRHGVMHTVRRAWEKACDRFFLRYERMWRRDRAGADTLARQRANPVEGAGLISIIVPVYNTAPLLLKAMAESFMAQSYTNWEACLYDGQSTKPETISMLDTLAQQDERIRVLHGKSNEGISGNSNHALAMAKGEWIALCDHDDLLEPDALYLIAQTIQQQQPDMIYTDEDFINASGAVHTSPHFKPDFCPDTLRSGNYVCHLMALKRSLMDEIGGFRPAFDGSQDHDVALRASEKTERIAHIPRVLYHWRQMGASMSHQQLQRCLDAGARAVEEHIARLGYPGRVTHHNAQLRIAYDVDEKSSVRVIVSDEGENTLEPCLTALADAAWEHVTVTVISPRAPLAWLKSEITPAALNQAARIAREDYILFLRSSVMMQGRDWLREMLMYAQRNDVGAVTAMLTDKRGRIVHAGYAVNMENAVQCRGLGVVARTGGWHGLMNTSHNVAAVTDGCCMIRRDHFIPFDEAYHEGLGVVDWSLRLAKDGLRHVVTPFAKGVCTLPDTMERALLTGRNRHQEDLKRYLSAWADVEDPCYSSRFRKHKADFRAE